MTDTRTPLEETGTYAIGARPKGFSRILESIMHVGRGLLARTRQNGRAAEHPAQALAEQCRALLGHRGEATGLALANEILADYQALPGDERVRFFELLNEDFDADTQAILEAARAYERQATFETRSALAKAVEAPRRRLFRRLNMVPDGTRRLVKMRGELLAVIDERPDLKALDSDLRHLLIAWFNRGFLVMHRIDWNSPASVLEKIVTYEAVHEINGFEDLRTRLAEDRRCFAFFHPAMPDDPLIFVQIALTNGTEGAIAPLIARERQIADAREADTALFYSISNCHDGLRGISFGNFLLKQVIEELRRDLENIKNFVTLSPVPGLCQWIASVSVDTLSEPIRGEIGAVREILAGLGSLETAGLSDELESALLRLCAHYLLNAKRGGEPVDPVARFHLSNGAALERIHWKADCSPTGLLRSAGIMVNYAYRLNDIEKNHEKYFADGEVVASSDVRKLA
ncbi:MAG: malonyl-CoA decarboxylase [Gammaproteobacteria bacterium]|nr:malonyl-CoA decarboxylase [Gammaproteobacteria bacterium]